MDYKCVKTTCPYCGCGCQMLLEVLDGQVVNTLPSKEPHMNQGKLCIKGHTAHEFVHSKDRLTHPLIRKNGKLEKTTWEDAFNVISSKFSQIKNQYGGDSIGFFSSARSTNEENYLCQKLCRAAFKTNNVDHCARL
ncbi:molybdopterin oxidoreductase, 4Fe-4S region [Desulfobacula toluolica Tol2]|uniref:Molybdopterin oxidoreductase, 4Fe-4S region n=4 Tax=Desulfobacula TaxID=28222 RepID=K0NGY3_DESTT|nr:molybdopterin oxidoreductase, 4Fe-4S region [Desulfobacula toluolica Tol2]SDU06841.1 Molybdopterin oxidoreductase [Desulfobacula phenolica]